MSEAEVEKLESHQFCQSIDAVVWAKQFKVRFPRQCPSEDTMVGWFANAIMAGMDEQARRDEAHLKRVLTVGILNL